MIEPIKKTSPFVIAASVAVILFSLVGIAALTGLLPKRNAGTDPLPPETAQDRMQPAERPGAPARPQPLLGPLPQPSTRQVPPGPIAQQVPPGPIQQTVCPDCGVITSIRLVEKQGEGSALGVVAGGIVGGILGHQVGSGSGKDLATIAGAVGGGYAGSEIEKRAKATQVHEVTIRMDDGRTRTVTQQANQAFSVGSRVRIINGAIQPY